MPKLNHENANFAVVNIAFYGGGVVSYHKSYNAAEKASRREEYTEVVPINESARAEIFNMFYPLGYFDRPQDIKLLDELRTLEEARSPYELVRR